MFDIRGFIPTSLSDWDGKVSSVLFLPKCNFRCPFCDNGVLVENPESLSAIPFEEIEKFLIERKGFLDGVVISGGEPCIHPWLPDLIKRIKSLGLLIKLDTNGSNPSMLYALCSNRLINYLAMDLKAPLDERYCEAAGMKVDLEKIKESVNIIMASGLDYEFRTTVVPLYHDEKEIEDMAKAIEGAKRFFLQQFVPDHTLDEKLRVIAPYPKEKLAQLVEIAKKYVKICKARNV